MNRDSSCAVIPMKPLSRSKLRLASTLAPGRRATLSLWMLERVGRAVKAADGVSAVAVLGGDTDVRALSEQLGLLWYADEAGDLNAALNGFYRSLAAPDLGALVYVAGDLPRVQASDIAALLQAGDGADVVLVPGARGGTNALMVRMGLDFAFELGGESFARHQEQSRRKGLNVRTCKCRGLEADVDLPDDLRELERSEPNLWEQVARTARLLGPLSCTRRFET